MKKPFEGIRILDFTHQVSGPFATYQLALLGADVLKVEPRGGESLRFSPQGADWGKRGYALNWLSMNSNKRSLTLDLKSPESVEIVKRLAAETDVVVENFRVGVMDRLGMGYEALRQVNPKLIYCAVTGFGQKGPESGTGAFDGVMQALSGMMSVNGDSNTGPLRAGYPAADITSGWVAAFAISSALFQRSHTGKGQYVDVAMMDATMSVMVVQMTEFLVGGLKYVPMGNRSVSQKPTADLFPTGEGKLMLGVLTDQGFAKFMTEIGCSGLLNDPRYSNWANRISNAEELRRHIVTALARRSATEWERRFREVGVPCARVRDIEGALSDPQLDHRALLQAVDGPFGPMTVFGSPFRLADGEGGVNRAPPLPGQDADAVLQSIGYSTAEIARLREDAVI